MEDRLKNLVEREQNYLSTKNNDQLNRYKDDLLAKHLFNPISTFLSSRDGQVS